MAKHLADEAAITKTIVAAQSTVGFVMCWEESGVTKVGCFIGEDFSGQEIASAALGLVLSLVSTRPLLAQVTKHNIAARQVLEKLGFTFLGEEAGVDEQGDLVGLIQMALLR